MKLDDLCELFDREGVPQAHVREHPDRDAVLAARSAVTAAVRDDEFLVDCVAYELTRLKQPGLRPGLVPFFILPEKEFGVRFRWLLAARSQCWGARTHGLDDHRRLSQ